LVVSTQNTANLESVLRVREDHVKAKHCILRGSHETKKGVLTYALRRKKGAEDEEEGDRLEDGLSRVGLAEFIHERHKKLIEPRSDDTRELSHTMM
jgi:hypothetical protein